MDSIEIKVYSLSLTTEALHQTLLAALNGPVHASTDAKRKPLILDCNLPLPPRTRCYVYNLVAGGPQRPNEFKAVLRVPGQPSGHYGSFDESDGRLVLVLAYHSALAVWVLWDSSQHPRFKNGGNIQVSRSAVYEAAASGWSAKSRRISGGRQELVIACQTPQLADAICKRLLTTGADHASG